MSKCGAVLANHWSHIGDNCGHESDVHQALKLLFAFSGGHMEVSPKGVNRRADVMVGRTVYEIQHSPIADKAARAREDDWTAAGYEVVWVIDGDAGITVASSNVVRVRLLPDYRLTMWCDNVDPETFDPLRLGRTAAAMAQDMLGRSKKYRALRVAEEAERAAEEAQRRMRESVAIRDHARSEAQEAVRERAAAERAAREAKSKIDAAARDREKAERALQTARELNGESVKRREHQAAIAAAAWIQERTGVRNIGMLRRIAVGDDAAAAVIAAIDTRNEASVRAALGKATPEQAARRVSDTCMVWAGIGADGFFHCCRIWSGEREIFNNVAEALLWCVEGLPAPVGQEN